MTAHRFTDDDVQIVARTREFQGYFAIDRYRVRHRTFAGGWTGEITREIFERGHAVVVILYDPERDAIALIEQFRMGALAAGQYPWLIECVAGIIEDGETPEQVALREAEEEAGATPEHIEHVGKFIITPGGSSETVELFVAKVDTSTIDGLHGLEHEGEDIRVFTVPVEEAYAMVKDGRVANSMAVIAVQWLMLERQELRRRWQR
ncbi:NUDIX domain-containing protein [Magnetospirillum aberrantis]|uniref:ADP-ribose pyrophosphatase n=1 Tax=Magnetospirillum aberrantis SpK TaxID=908842 RepID=A0A7C9QTD7_9PROT|nr:NUDIX domain-containing protein [Magnetospirillum aberrantis]NFV80203.1 NUDIX domain-containing protein [Magnetospirillum aberrantis SpK]